MALVSELLSTTASSCQASISVLLVLTAGYLARKTGLVTKAGEQNISKLGTTLLLPCLLFSEMGGSATWSSLKSYWPIPVWALAFQLLSLSFALGLKATSVIPAAFVPSFVFNNVTSLPLLLIESLSASGSLDGLAVDHESASKLLKHGRVLFLINALVSNISRFAFGPALMSPSSYHESNFLPSNKQDKSDAEETSEDVSGDDVDDQRQDDESAPLLPRQVRGGRIEAGLTRARRSKVGSVARTIAGAFNPPLIGGLLAIFCGMISPIRHVVFEKGWAGWIDPATQAVSKLGNLFTGLQMFILGSALKSKRSADVSKRFLAILFTWRFIVVPALSIGAVWLVSKHSSNIITDPMMAFVLAMAPVGPPALTLCAIADLADITEEIESQIARIILLSYAVTPFISVSVVVAITVAKMIKA